MNFKRNMIVVGAALLTFIGTFITIRSCNAADQVTPAPTAAKVEKTEAEVTQDLLGKVKAELAETQAALVAAETLTEKVKISKKVNRLEGVIEILSEQKAEQQAEVKKDTRTYVQVAADEFSDLVPVYAGNESEVKTGFGQTLVTGLNKADSERDEVKAVKLAVMHRLQEAHTRAVLDQDSLHVPEYSALLQQAPRNPSTLETIQQERLRDEAAIEELANPGFWQMAKWWWNS